MINETIARIEARLNESNLSEESRQELKTLLTTLRGELEALARTNAGQARSIAKLTERTAHEAMRSGKDEHSLGQSIKDLENSIQGLEASHPALVQLANSICLLLSNTGI